MEAKHLEEVMAEALITLEGSAVEDSSNITLICNQLRKSLETSLEEEIHLQISSMMMKMTFSQVDSQVWAEALDKWDLEEWAVEAKCVNKIEIPSLVLVWALMTMTSSVVVLVEAWVVETLHRSNLAVLVVWEEEWVNQLVPQQLLKMGVKKPSPRKPK